MEAATAAGGVKKTLPPTPPPKPQAQVAVAHENAAPILMKRQEVPPPTQLTAKVAPVSKGEEIEETTQVETSLQKLEKMRQTLFKTFLGTKLHPLGEKEAIEKYLKEVYGDSEITVDCLMEKADSHSLDSAMDYYQKAIKICDKLGNKKKKLEILSRLIDRGLSNDKWRVDGARLVLFGRVRVTHGVNYDKPLEYAKEALPLTVELFGEFHNETAELCSTLGFLYEITLDRSKAKQYYQRALTIFNSPDTKDPNLEEKAFVQECLEQK